MNNYKVLIHDEEEFTVKSNIQIYESDCIVFKNKSYFVYKREGSNLFVRCISKTVNTFE
ncbi:hypothetical protein SAMN04487895_101687 [Paenibacillus sophorae]|uniref:Uncharacterized protein n=1 Tax=Paenibacillus sophorae TaxID=1333845 RepID=A0A1H8GZ27_9BACL|nr:hypothetical protein SAMN04487895_101687 [Paenibacillus sophorae]